jgi:hypothetical protein
MRTLIIILVGFALLAGCLLVAKAAAGSTSATSKKALIFLPLWLACAAVNMWIGIAKAGYSFKEESPIFLVIFALPAAGALFAFWRVRSS